MISLHFQGKPFKITVILFYAPTTNAKKAKAEQVYEDLQDFLELTPKKKSPFHHRGLECKSRKSRDTWSNRQVWPWSTKWSRAEANRVLPKECYGCHSKHPLATVLWLAWGLYIEICVCDSFELLISSFQVHFNNPVFVLSSPHNYSLDIMFYIYLFCVSL